MTQDIRVILKVKNNNLLSAIEEKGFVCGQKFSKLCGISYQTLIDLVNMTKSPLDKDGNYRQSIFKMCEILNKMPDDLFSNEQKYMELESNSSSFEVNYDEIPKLMSKTLTLENFQGFEQIDKALSTLMPKEKYILEMRYGLYGNEKTLDELANEIGATKERVRQIQERALRKLRHPNRSEELKPLYCETE